jgi:hypothetical protein
MLIELERIISNSWGGTKILVNYLSNKVLKHLAVAFNALEGFSLLIEMIYVYFFTDLCFDMSKYKEHANKFPSKFISLKSCKTIQSGLETTLSKHSQKKYISKALKLANS